jgi:hypothetical protein
LSEPLTDFILGEEVFDSDLDLTDPLVQDGKFARQLGKEFAA